ncbi:uncharacterized protein LOC110732904 [Chenopodium quinoa]|uniref:uncharacterized protein LOC110732904 n=1 Tax=Chenopodium quinoa TaxID=63459 RepID=UPI000B792B73|nr:uncharacterized protein LOC110732904 [Chenopodium quinoa]
MGEGEATNTISDVGYPTNNNNDHYYNHHKKPPTSKNKTNMFKGGLMNVIKVVLYMLRRKSDKTGKKLSPSLSTATNTSLTNFVGAFRPFHLQRDVGGMTSSSPHPQILFSRHDDEVIEASPYHSKYDASSSSSSSSRSSSSRGDMSRYASAQSLNDLDNVDEDSDEEEGMMIDGDAYYDGLEGDEMIDDKADKFIAKFYQQMRLQNF